MAEERDILEEGHDLLTVQVRVKNSYTEAGHTVEYTAEYLLRVYRRSNNADLESIVMNYKDQGEDAKQTGLQVKVEENGVTSYLEEEYVLYVPHDVKSGDIAFTADSEGARIGVSLSPINPNVASTVPAKLERHQVTLEGQGVKDGDKIYV